MVHLLGVIISDIVGIADNFEQFARLYITRGSLERSIRLFSYANELRAKIGVVPFPLEVKLIENDLSTLRAKLGDKDFGIEWEYGKTLDINVAIQEVLENFGYDKEL